MDLRRNIENFSINKLSNQMNKQIKSNDVKQSFDGASFKLNIENNLHPNSKNSFCIDSLLSKNGFENNYNSDVTEMSSEKEFYDMYNKNSCVTSETNLRYNILILSIVE